MKITQKTRNQGQALITLLFFVVIAITITTAAVIIIITSTTAAAKFQEGIKTYYVAESGIENAFLRLLRDPNYAGETLTVEDGTAIVTVTGTSPYVITSVGEVGNFIRTIEAQADYTSGVLSVISWEEI